ncbi:acyl carrier protein [Streptomyces hawaiiensis]|jgi:acyl carrier protein|uniref:acyl carrier protein n=1 Tax=Streptomyces hawaiiensis TaxID=67305 RepID=UPI00364A4048
MSETVEEISDIVVAVIGEVLACNPQDLRDQPVLAAHDWDSITSLEALAQLESGFKVRLELRDFHAARTTDEMTALIAKALDR